MTSPCHRRNLAASVLCTFLIWTICPPLQALDPDRSLAQLSHRRWSAAEGLPGDVGALAQTRDGYLWIGAGRSLFRFDGVRFIQYVTPDGATLPTVSALLATPDGTLWVGLRFGGIHRIDPASHHRYDATDGVPGGVVYGFAAERGGTIWAAVDEGLVRLRNGRWHPVSAAEGFDGHHARAVFVDAGDAVWAASEDRLFRRAAGATRFEATNVSIDWVSQIAQDPGGAIWLAHRYNGGVRAIGQTENVLLLDSTGIAFDRDGNLWIGTLGNGVVRVTAGPARDERTVMNTFTAGQGLSDDYVRRVLEDAEGNLWVGTRQGLDRFRDTPFVTAEVPGGAPYSAIAPDHEGGLWIGSINRPVMRLSTGGVAEISMPPPVTAAIADRDGAIWMGGPNGIWRSTNGNLVQVAELPPGGQSDGAVRAMVRDRHGTLWVSVNNLGLFQWRGDAWLPQPPVSTDSSQIMPVTSAADRTGRLWFGYRNGLLTSKDVDTGKFDVWGPRQGVAVGHVTALYGGTRFWIGGQRGIAYLDGNRFRPVSITGAELEGVYGLVETAGGDLWIYSLSGAFRIERAELDQAARDVDHRARVTRFDDVPALPDDATQVRPLPALVATPDGRLWFATGSGVVWVDPARLASTPPAPHVTLEETYADDKLLSGTGPIAVPALTERLRLQYSAPALGYPERLRFRFILEGYDERWQEAGDRREAVYTRLPPGRYQFRVATANQGTSWNETSPATDIIVTAAFHQTVVFQALLATAFIGLLWLGYRMRLRHHGRRLRLRLEERHRERERIARDLHDTLLQSVQGLLLKFHAATERLAPSDPARPALLGVLDRAEQVLEEGRDLVQGLRRDDEPLGTLADSLLDAAHESTVSDPPHLRVTIQGEVRPLETVVHEEVLHIGREALFNAFRHARAAHVEVEIGYGRRTFHLRVRDDGIGMSAAHTRENGRAGHFGIPGMYERAAQIGATLELWSRANSGTEVNLQLPSSIAYRRRAKSNLRD